MRQRWLVVAAVAGFLGVALGAFGAHGLDTMLKDVENRDRLMENFETGARYHMYHALALIGVALAAGSSRRAVSIAGWSFVVGILVFSGSLYVLALTGQRWLGMITPIGGVAFLVGWAALAAACWRDEGRA